MTNEWDKRESESDQEYRWFLAYLALGAGRVIADVRLVVMPKSATERKRKGGEPKPRNGAMEAACTKHSWIKRAGAYDLSLMQAALQTTGIMVVDGLREFAKLYIDSLRTAAKASIKPKNWQDVIAGVNALSTLFPPEVIAALLQSRNDGDQSTGGDGSAGV